VRRAVLDGGRSRLPDVRRRVEVRVAGAQHDEVAAPAGGEGGDLRLDLAGELLAERARVQRALGAAAAAAEVSAPAALRASA
jgi:hypothetical protein